MHKTYPERFEKINTAEALLRRPSYQVDIRNDESVKKCQEMIATIEAILIINNDSESISKIREDNILGYGLAACQIKKLHTLETIAPRLSVITIPSVNDSTKAIWLRMINPQIIHQNYPIKYKGEGCLSFPGKYLSTQRFKLVKVGFIDANTLEPREMEFFGFEAVVMQHEIDHHNGTLFMDRHQTPIISDKKVGPNDKCPCGSGKKYKKCCG